MRYFQSFLHIAQKGGTDPGVGQQFSTIMRLLQIIKGLNP